MTEKEKYTFRALLNEEKTWREFDRLSLKFKRKDKKDIKIEKIETNIEKFKASKIIKFLESSFSQKKFWNIYVTIHFRIKEHKKQKNRNEIHRIVFIVENKNFRCTKNQKNRNEIYRIVFIVENENLEDAENQKNRDEYREFVSHERENLNDDYFDWINLFTSSKKDKNERIKY
jgi:hypothetical protein